MIVDIHTHLLAIDTDGGPQLVADMRRCGIDPGAWRFTPEEHLRATAAADVVVVFGLLARRTGWHAGNDPVAEHVRRNPDRLIFFAAVDPADEGFMDELVRCHQDLGCKGVKLGPIYQGVHPLDQRCYEIYRYCTRHGLPIMIHMATTFSSGVPLEYALPRHMDTVASEFPDLRIVLAHLGHPWEPEALAAIRHQPNLYADLSALYYRPWQFYNSMRLACEYGTTDKILFGSDFPATTTESSLAGLRAVNAVLGNSGLPPVSESSIEEIIHRDSLAALQLADPRPKSKP